MKISFVLLNYYIITIILGQIFSTLIEHLCYGLCIVKLNIIMFKMLIHLFV